MKATEIAWLAGIFDGEGCVWSRWPKRVNVIVEISMSSKQTIDRINELFSGRVSSVHLSRLSIKPQWRWSLDTDGARRFLNAIYPYSVTKREEVQIALALCERPVTAQFDDYAARLRALHA